MEGAGPFQGVGHVALPCSTVALNGHNKYWLQRGLFAFCCTTIEEGEAT